MRLLIVSILLTVFSANCFAQAMEGQQVQERKYVTFDVCSDSWKKGDIKMMLSANSAWKFMRDLRRIEKKVDMLAEKAKTQNLRDYKVALDGSYAFSRLSFSDGNEENLMEYNYNNYLIPFFTVDKEGNCSLVLGGYFYESQCTMAATSDTNADKFFFYMSIPVHELDLWICDHQVARPNYEELITDVEVRNYIIKG